VSLFSKPEATVDLARNILPGKYLKNPGLENAVIGKGSFVDRDLHGHVTGLLVRFKRTDRAGELYLYLLTDHKSRRE
jgi:hypothetical protein